MKKLLVLLSLVSLATWMFSFLAMNYSPVVHIFLLLSFLFYIRSVITIENPRELMQIEGPGNEQPVSQAGEHSN
jgi:hypothetical protein